MATRTAIVIDGGWRGSFSDNTLQHLKTFYEEIDNGLEEDKRFSSTIFNLSDEMIDQVISGGTPIPNAPLGALKPHQTLGSRYLITVGSGLLTDAVGLGKTAVVSSYLNLLSMQVQKAHNRPLRALFLTEVNLVEQAKRELVRFTNKPFVGSTGQAKDVKNLVERMESGNGNLIVGSYSLCGSHKFVSHLSKFVEEYGKFDVLLVDESSVMKNKKAFISDTLSYLKKNFFTRMVIMNATPFEKDYTTLYNQLDILDSDLLPHKNAFEKEFVKTHHLTRNILGYRNLDVLKERLKYHVFGTTRSELGVSVGDTTLSVYLYQRSPIQAQLYSKTRYKSVLFEEPNWIDPKITFTKDNIPKLSCLEEVVNAIGDDRLMIYCKRLEAQEGIRQFLEELGIKAKLLNGTHKQADKVRLVQELKDNEYQVLITNVQKGLNLDFVPHLFFYTFTSNAGLLAQIEGRIIRSNAINNKHIYLAFDSSHEIEDFFNARKNHLEKTAIMGKELSPLTVAFDKYHEEIKQMRDSFIVSKPGDYKEKTFIIEAE